jgi:hypothetical protein
MMRRRRLRRRRHSGYSLVGQNAAAWDMYGHSVSCDAWDGGSGFL